VRYKIRTVTPLAEVPLAVSLAEAKAFMKVTSAAEDDLITGMIRTGMEMVEKYSGHVLTERELEMVTCGFPVLPELISLPRDPVTEISRSPTRIHRPAKQSTSTTAPGAGRTARRTSCCRPGASPGPLRPTNSAACGSASQPAMRRISALPLLVDAVKKTVLQLYDGRCEGGRLSDDVQEGLRYPFGPALI
jgi:hypothetical protein